MAILLFAALGAACAGPAARAQTLGTAPGSSDLTSVVETARAARRQAVRSLRATVTLHLSSPEWEGAGTCEGLLVARRPAELRLRGYAAFLTVFDVVTDRERFWFYVPARHSALTGTAAQESLVTGLPLLPGEIVNALFAEPYGSGDRPLRALEGASGPWVVWTLEDGHEVRARYRLDPVLLERAELYQDGRLEASLDYHDYRKLKGVWWPMRLDFDWPGDGGRMSLDFEEVTFNRAVEAGAFRFDPPSGVEVVRVARADEAQ